MAVTVSQYVEALFLSLEEVGEKDHDQIIENLVKILKANEDLDKFEKIIHELEQKMLQKNITAEVTTTSKMKVDKDIIDKINQLAGNKADITHEVDDTLIGGVIIKVDDTMLDTSIKTKLENLRTTLIK